jgi:hypothetical protein
MKMTPFTKLFTGQLNDFEVPQENILPAKFLEKVKRHSFNNFIKQMHARERTLGGCKRER